MIVCKQSEIIATNVVMGDCFFKRLVGLMNRKEMEDEEGLLLKPCNQIHTYQMKFPIDAVFLSNNGIILHIEHNMTQNKISKYIKAADCVLELNSNVAKRKNLQVGDKLEFSEL